MTDPFTRTPRQAAAAWAYEHLPPTYLDEPTYPLDPPTGEALFVRAVLDHLDGLRPYPPAPAEFFDPPVDPALAEGCARFLTAATLAYAEHAARQAAERWMRHQAPPPSEATPR